MSFFHLYCLFTGLTVAALLATFLPFYSSASDISFFFFIPYGWIFMGFSCYFGGLFCSLHFSLFPLLQHAHFRRTVAQNGQKMAKNIWIKYVFWATKEGWLGVCFIHLYCYEIFSFFYIGCDWHCSTWLQCDTLNAAD